MTDRVTFNKKVSEVAWQKQIRDSFMEEGTPDVPHLDVKDSIVREISYNEAREIILKYEWLGTMAKSNRHFGIFFGDKCAGVCCVIAGNGAGGLLTHKMLGIEQCELGVLARGACVHWAPKNTNSRLVSQTIKLLKKTTDLKILIAYSDVDAGEIGTIYQACNWTYIGKGSSNEQFVSPDGRVYDRKIIYDTRRKNGTLETLTWGEQKRILLDSGWKSQRSSAKHRYVYVLDNSDNELTETIQRMEKTFPKRAR